MNYINIFSDILPLAELKEVVKVYLILSHGNAIVVSGFSINQLILDVNMKKQSLVTQRIVYEEVTNEGGPIKANINSNMIKSVRLASNRYKFALEESK